MSNSSRPWFTLPYYTEKDRPIDAYWADVLRFIAVLRMKPVVFRVNPNDTEMLAQETISEKDIAMMCESLGQRITANSEFMVIRTNKHSEDKDWYEENAPQLMKDIGLSVDRIDFFRAIYENLGIYDMIYIIPENTPPPMTIQQLE
jgi:hypothetical protein